MKGRKIGVYIPGDIEDLLEDYLARHGGRSVSSVIQEALRSYLLGEKIPECELVGYIMVLYQHGVGDVDRELTEVQHKYIGVALFENHIHVDEERCLLTIAVRGRYSEIQKLIDEVRGLKGVLLVKHLCVCV
ncbi:transcriptional regulator NikR, CopG family [Desulfurococcus mucosus DSM 2162]|uniref:Transcriptional regulator NikR, CopG family n=1 Tax=Desulfurococcus mucosus (strain ATCC 35584 / DSM 2162 / JCM 9187 / O7/1) TaxID=765177 RepID=E8R860_DESM0|nr:CopG family ribbon-helix-helix protein [Desulfurococcus mucosus]ADV64686.1 transcriptional regulator NikR, CopG family [Desulfurococcus mucosus DSM 2162]